MTSAPAYAHRIAALVPRTRPRAPRIGTAARGAGSVAQAPVDERFPTPETWLSVEARAPDAESLGWLRSLSGDGREREEAAARLHALLSHGARFELARRRHALGASGSAEVDDLATQAADDALMAIMRKLHTYRGDSRFTTWAYKFVLLEVAVKARRRAWQGREIPLEADGWALLADPGASPETDAQTAEVISAVRAAIANALTPHQRAVLVAVTLNDVPIDVLAERLATTRGALYKTLHDARKKLRTQLAEAGLDPGGGDQRRRGAGA
jgi:RNA polymerase sigma-70 factor (ECF subfamily)